MRITDLDEKHKTPASTDDIPHAEFVQTPRPQVNITPAESSSDVVQASSDARDPPSSPGHTNCVPRVDAEVPREQPIRSNSDLGKLSQPPSPITAIATPVSTPSAQDTPPVKLHRPERTTARHSRGTTLHQDIHNIFSHSSGSLFGESPPSEPDDPGSEE